VHETLTEVSPVPAVHGTLTEASPAPAVRETLTEASPVLAPLQARLDSLLAGFCRQGGTGSTTFSGQQTWRDSGRAGAGEEGEQRQDLDLDLDLHRGTLSQDGGWTRTGEEDGEQQQEISDLGGAVTAEEMPAEEASHGLDEIHVERVELQARDPPHRGGLSLFKNALPPPQPDFELTYQY